MYIDTSFHLPDQAENTGADIDSLARMCKAVGHPARIAILRHLLDQDKCICGRIVEILPLAQSTVSQHLKVLKESGLIKGEIEGLKTCYCVDKQNLNRLLETMAALFNQVNKK